MLIPIAYIAAARLYRGHTPERPLVWCAHAATVVMLVSSIRAALEGFFDPVVEKSINLALAAFAAEAAAEVEHLAGLAARDQPGRGAVVAEGGVAAAGCRQPQGECVEGPGEHDGLAAEPDEHLPVRGLDVAEGQAADHGRPLGVEEDEQAG